MHHPATVPHTLVPGPASRSEGRCRLLVLGPALDLPAVGRPAGADQQTKEDYDPTLPEVRARWASSPRP